ncbi:MAG: hypothetical protein E6I52_08300 [Chloroflexi bacterium]|nr:MAG: hypothetical protein E6I52_08300 [Chloroflexota bacterium]
MTFDAARRKEHEDQFAFRFVYDLRNYTQHSELPIKSFTLDWKADLDKQGDPVGHTGTAALKFILDPAELLANYDKWHRLVRADLAGMSHPLDVIALHTDMLASLTRIQLAVLKSEWPRIASGARAMQGLTSCLRHDALRPMLHDEDGMPLEEPPVDTVALVFAMLARGEPSRPDELLDPQFGWALMRQAQMGDMASGRVRSA